MKRFLIVFFIGLLSCAFGQQGGGYSSVMGDFLIENPGFFSSSTAYHLNSYYRNQWTGFTREPVYFTFNGHKSIHHDQMNLGLQLSSSSRNGSLITTAVMLPFSYRINVFGGKLSFGMQPELHQIKYDPTGFLAYDEDDVFLQKENRIWSDFSSGFFFRSKKILFSGGYKNMFSKKINGFIPEWSVFCQYSINVSANWEVEPLILIRGFENRKLLFIRSRIIFNKNYWLTLDGKNQSEIGIGMGMNLKQYISQDLRINYHYSVQTSDETTGFGSIHELTLSFSFIPRPKVEKIKNNKIIDSPLFLN